MPRASSALTASTCEPSCGKFLDRPLEAALLKPFLGAYNKKMAKFLDGIRPAKEVKLFDVEKVTVDGVTVDVTATARDVLPNGAHTVVLTPSTAPPADISEAEGKAMLEKWLEKDKAADAPAPAPNARDLQTPPQGSGVAQVTSPVKVEGADGVVV